MRTEFCAVSGAPRHKFKIVVMHKFKLLIFGLLGFGALQAQVETGTVVGVLVDETGEPLVAGTVRLDDRGALSDFEGRFELRNVEPGMQTLRFES